MKFANLHGDLVPYTALIYGSLVQNSCPDGRMSSTTQDAWETERCTS